MRVPVEIESKAQLLLGLQSGGRWDIQKEPALAQVMHILLHFLSAEMEELRLLQKRPWGCPCLPLWANGLCSYCIGLSFKFKWLKSEYDTLWSRFFFCSGIKACYFQMPGSWHEQQWGSTVLAISNPGQLVTNWILNPALSLRERHI